MGTNWKYTMENAGSQRESLCLLKFVCFKITMNYILVARIRLIKNRTKLG